MNYKMMGRFIAQILSLEGIFMLPALTISLYLGEHPAIRGFAATIVILLAISAALRMLCRGAKSSPELDHPQPDRLPALCHLPGDPQIHRCPV